MIPFDQIKQGQSYSVKIIKENDSFDVLVLCKGKNLIYVLLDPSVWSMSYNNEIEKLKTLSIQDFRDGKSYYIEHDLDEEIVVYDYINDKILTCLGFELIFEKETEYEF